MLTTTRTRLAALAITGAMSLGGAGAAQAATQQDGLVNVNVENVTAQVPIGIAANVCDVNANVLAEQLRGGGASCTATPTTIATNGPGNGGGSTHQSGLVNVNAQDLVVQVPVALAANICDVNVGVLSRQLNAGGATCNATASAITQH